MKKRSGLNVMMRLIGLVKPLAVYMIIAIIMGLIGNLCATFITIFGGYAIVSAVGGTVPLSLVALFICVVAFAVLRGGLRYAEQSCNHFIAFKLLALIRDKVFKALRTLCPAKLEGRDKGDLISVITSDIELLEVFYAHTVSPAAIWLLFTVIMSVFIGSYNYVSGLIALSAYIIVGIIVPVVISKLSGDSGIKFRTKSGELSSFVLESLRGLSETIQYGAGKNRLEKMNSMTDNLSCEEARMKRMTGRNMAVTNSIILIFDLAMLFCGVALYNSGTIGFDGVLITTIALFSSFGPSVALANLGSTLQNTFAAGNRVLDILDEKPSVAEITGCEHTEFGNVSVSNVSFSYGGETILQNISLTVPANKVIGIVGKSGSGKSTLLKLMMRFWNVIKGDISVKDRSITDINTAELRDMESYVTQETHLFHDSIKSNLKIAKLDATDEEIITACKKASVHDFIMTLPQGYDTPVGELGDTLSGGERQRIGLARAFLHDAPLMLLDEPTSNLDSLNEAVILRSLGEESKDKTVVLVSHRESTMRIADTVYSVENGRMS
ncbi:MAG: ABC transporter ATP-binding protein [[Eubacterium] siraeum]|nr:ABC transporter ATP-binding protein [[Eubacterium] siraeum]MDE8716299.1 ABC transporter ATP-binding protein [[Eubacterium] siraeum]